MKTTCKNWLVLLSLVIGAGSAWAEMVPPGLIDKLRIVGIQKWELVQTNFAYINTYPQNGEEKSFGQKVLKYAIKESGLPPSETPALSAPYYIINMTVAIENGADANVLLEDPQFTVTILETKEDAEVLGTQQGGGQVFKGANSPKYEVAIKLGMARLVADRESKVWTPKAQIPCPEGAQKAKESLHQFEVIVGAADSERAKKIFDAFNAMNNQSRRWALRLDGGVTMGWRNKGNGKSTVEAFASDETKLTLESKPVLPEQIPFPK